MISVSKTSTLQKLPGNTIRQQQLRNVCFTINNPSLDMEELAQTLKEAHSVSYFVFGKEVGESGTPHYQGYVELKHSVEFMTIHKLLCNGHIEARRGTVEQAVEYCRKDGEFTEWGTVSAQGERNDIKSVAELVKSGAATYEIAMTYPVQYIRYHKGIQALQSALIEPRVGIPEVRVYHGPTGTGKSYEARCWLPNAYVWHPQQGQWFDGYQGESEVVFEEFRGQIPFGMLLSLLDRYCCKVQYKGGVTQFAATKIAITSPIGPEDWYLCLDDNDRLDQLYRRLTKVEHLQIKIML